MRQAEEDKIDKYNSVKERTNDKESENKNVKIENNCAGSAEIFVKIMCQKKKELPS